MYVSEGEVNLSVWKGIRLLLLVVAFCGVLAVGQRTEMTISRLLAPPLRGVRIAIDPGHGGVDDGTQVAGRHLEKDVNLQLGLATRQLLQSMGAEVLMTRETDRELSRSGEIYVGRHREDLSRRVEIIDSADCDLFISLHCNSAPGHPSSRGPIVYYHPDSPSAGPLAAAIQTRLNRMNLQPFGATQRPHVATTADYFLLRHTKTMGVLVEAGFLSNATDLRLLTDKEFQQAFAVNLVLGIADFLQGDTAAEVDLSCHDHDLLLILPVDAEKPASWAHYLASPLPLTFLLDSRSTQWQSAAEQIRQAGHDVLVREQADAHGSPAADCWWTLEDSPPERTTLAIGAPSLQRRCQYQVSGVVSASSRNQLLGQLTQILQSRPPQRSIVLLEAIDLLPADNPALWLEVARLLQTQNVRPIFASDLLLPIGEPEEVDIWLSPANMGRSTVKN
jgi:N-acetylmuramoyl-L-alanine amidase